MHTIKPHPILLENVVLGTVHYPKVCQRMKSGAVGMESNLFWFGPINGNTYSGKKTAQHFTRNV